MNPFFCYYGGKWRIAPRYPQPLHRKIVEPFAGGAGYATRYYERDVMLVERDPQIAELWRYLIRVSSAEVRALPLIRPDQTIDDLGSIPAGSRSLIGFWLNKGSAVPKRTPSAWMRAGKHNSSFWGEEIRARIAAQVEKIRHWTIVEGDYATAPYCWATWFIDPPYEVAGRRYRFWKVDYAHLAEWSRDRRGLTIVCENEGATWLPFEAFHKSKANESKAGGKVSAEVIWTQHTFEPHSLERAA